ncbi:restriction endonuclease [Kribbella sp. NPDC000426]|uniref:restriction endonuclease n=1 Tax=Kribbella sp. NPDC000426 TaxID=3154255 RepID=UPI003322DF65
MPREPLWKEFERSVHQFIAQLDPTTIVRHDQRLPGLLSGALRQVDVWATGSLAGAEITVAFECKRYRRPVAVGTIDEFAGKLQDLGADRGIVYSYSGFTPAAVNRAARAYLPKIQALELPFDAEPYDGPLSSVMPDLSTEPSFYAPVTEDVTAESIRRFLSDGEWIA